MRIIGGSHRGRVIDPPRNLRARPTTDFAKENLFNVLGNLVDFEGLRVLDLFAGTGSISYEFASRGAAEVVSVEINSVHYNFIRRTASVFGFESIHAVKANAFLYLKSTPRVFDLVFADAPYELPGTGDVIDLVLSRELLRGGGLLVFEHGRGADYSSHPCFVQVRGYGSVLFSIFEKK